jgi:hypothetical protein
MGAEQALAMSRFGEWHGDEPRDIAGLHPHQH